MEPLNSLQNTYQWDEDNTEIKLVMNEYNDLIWNISCYSTKANSNVSFIESTIPSSRCHPETVAIIEKIKNESLKPKDQKSVMRLMEDFKVVRVWNDVTIKKERATQGKMHEYCVPGKWDLYKLALSIVAPALTLLTPALVAATGPVIIPVYIATLYAAPVSIGYDIYQDEKRIKRNEELYNKIPVLSPQKPLLIEIEPRITAPSVIDSRVLVSKFIWAVTLVSHGGANCIGEKPNKYSDGNHAEIYIEGINDGFYDKKSILIRNAKPIAIDEKFVHLAHFMPPIESGLLSPNNVEFETRSEIWMVTSDKVKTMLRNIEIEKTLPRGQRHNFNIYGEGAILGEEGHNCFTWARYHLESIGINLKRKKMPPNSTGIIASLVTDYTKKPTKYTETPIQRI